MRDRGRMVTREGWSGNELVAARIASDGWQVEVQTRFGNWYATFNAGSEISELILEDNYTVTAVLMNGQKIYATTL